MLNDFAGVAPPSKVFKRIANMLLVIRDLLVRLSKDDGEADLDKALFHRAPPK